jgi:GntR family transcriptional regulator, transcriptional repressor for pyruvate dehydrogenase complex
VEMIKRTNLSEAVSQRLLSLISSGELKAASKLPSEAELCQTLGVSRTAVREGIKALAGIGILTVLPGRGTFVNDDPGIIVSGDVLKIALEKEDIHSIYEIRHALDVGIARFVALKAAEEDIEALRKAVRKMEKAFESEPIDFQSATEGDEDFHLAFYRAAHNRVLENIARPVITHAMVRTWRQMRSSIDFGRAAMEGHREILAGVEKRNVRKVIDAVERHLRTVFEGIAGP